MTSCGGLSGSGQPGDADSAGERPPPVRPPRIRRMQPQDWRALRRVRLAALASAPYAFASTLAREQQLGERQWRVRLSSAAYFGAWSSGELTGIAAGWPDDPGRSDSVPGSWHLVSMWVSPPVRGQGIGDAIVEAIAKAARAAGAGRLVLWVTDANPQALAFYRRLGFRSTGRRQLVRPDEPDHWEEQLARELGSSAEPGTAG